MTKFEELPPAIAFVGTSGSGKTTLAEKVIAILTESGYKVGAIKHHTKMKFEIDKPGKDSYRFTQAGSVHTVIAAQGKIAQIQKVDHDPGFLELVSLMTDCDVVIAEGYRHDGLRTIEVLRREVEDVSALDGRGVMSREETLALATDYDPLELGASAAGRPVLDLNDPQAIVAFVLDALGLLGTHAHGRGDGMGR